MQDRNILISGLTAAGKTTHAKLLARHLGYEYVSASRIMLELAGLEEFSHEGVWFRTDSRLRSVLTDTRIARALTQRLMWLADRRTRQVIDAWGLAWVFDGPLLRLWIESDRLSRAWKAYISQGEAPGFTVLECAHIVDQKDLQTRDLFGAEYGIDIFQDRRPFDAVLDNSWVIKGPTHAASLEGIEEFGRTVISVVTSLLADDCSAIQIGTDTFMQDGRYAGIQVRTVRQSPSAS